MSISRYKLISVLFFFCFGFNGISQSVNNISFVNWQKKDGLPSNNIQSIEKDKLGFLWIATNDGLCRFDGPNLIKVYRQPENDQKINKSLKSSNIRTLHCDSKGVLWIGTKFGGLTTFDPVTNNWKNFRHDVNDGSSLNNDEVLVVFEDSKKRIWVGTEKGLNLYHPETASFTRFLFSDDKENNQ